MPIENTWPLNTRYEDAHLSKIDFTIEHNEKLNNWLKNQNNMLIFTSNPGVGKTYFCAAVANYFKGKTPVFYLKDREFFNELRTEIENYSYNAKKMAGYQGIWILDDIGSAQLTPWQIEVLTTFIDERYENKMPLIITSNVWINQMHTIFTPRFADRIKASENTILEIHGESKRSEGM